jgi:hypothetical protein
VSLEDDTSLIKIEDKAEDGYKIIVYNIQENKHIQSKVNT